MNKSTKVLNLNTEEICQAFKLGLGSIDELAIMYKCSDSAIRYHLKKGNCWPSFEDIAKETKIESAKETIQDLNEQTKKKAKKKADKGFTRKVLNYILESDEDVFTIESIAKVFNKSTNEACGALSTLAKKNCGIKRTFRGTYEKINKNPKVSNETANPEIPETLLDSSNDQKRQDVGNSNDQKRQDVDNSNGQKQQDHLDLISRILILSKDCGGLNKLISHARLLQQVGGYK